MKMLTFAAGLAAGYVLGTKAGRERFDQLVRGVRKVGDHPTVVQAQDKVKEFLSSNTDRHQPSASTTTPAAATAPPKASPKASPARPSATSSLGTTATTRPVSQ
jgi:hypothetical protein